MYGLFNNIHYNNNRAIKRQLNTKNRDLENKGKKADPIWPPEVIVTQGFHAHVSAYTKATLPLFQDIYTLCD